MLYSSFLRSDYYVYEDEDGTCKVEIQVPGATKDDVTIDIANRTLSVSVKPSKGKIKSEVSKLFDIPRKYDVEAISASVSDGILTVSLPLEKSEKPKRIAVAAA